MSTATTSPSPDGAQFVDHKLHRAWHKERRFQHIRGVCYLLLWVAALILLDLLVDWLFLIPGVARLVLMAVNVGAILWVIYHHWWRYLHRYDAVRTALQVERRHPELQSMLVSFVQLGEAPRPDTYASPSLIRALRRQTLEYTRPIDFREIVSYKELKRIFVLSACVLLFFGAISINWSEHFRVLVYRMLNPRTQRGYPTRTDIDYVTGSKSVKQGKKRLTIRVRGSGLLPKEGSLYVKPVGGSWEKLALQRAARGPFELAPADVADLPRLCSHLIEQGSAQGASVGKRLWELLAPDDRDAIRQTLEASTADDARRTGILDALNDIVSTPDVFRETELEGLELPDEITDILKLGPDALTEEQAQKINRAVLEVAFPNDIEATSREGSQQAAAVEGEFAYVFGEIYQSFTYRVRLGDDSAGPFDVAVVPPPRIIETRVLLDYPPYTDLKNRTVDILNLEVPEGTKLTWELECDQALAAALMVRDGTERLPMALDSDGHVARLTATATASFAYQFRWMERAHNYPYDEDVHYFVQVIPDTAPQVEILRPLEDEKATARKTAQITFQARDDYGLADATIVYSLNAGEDQTHPIGPCAGRLVEKEVAWKLADDITGLKPGDVVTYHIQVSDTYAGPDGPFTSISQTRRLYIVTLEEYLTYMAERRRKLIAEIRALHKQESDAADEVGGIKTGDVAPRKPTIENR